MIVEKGPAADQGRSFSIPANGMRIGRSSKNDIVLVDPLLSRHHCRMAFTTDGELRVSDLGSANETRVNGKTIQDERLRTGDLVTIGDTSLRVVNDKAPTAVSNAGPVDLGLVPEETVTGSRRKNMTPIILVGVLLLVLALVIWVPKLLPDKPTEEEQPPPVPEVEQTLEIDYEKVEASADNIFRYHLTLSADNEVAIEIDDIINNRHVRKEQPVSPDYIRDLADDLRASGFFALSDIYEGIQPGIHHAWDVSITTGRRTHRSVVRNRIRPDLFRAVTDMIEEFGKNELDLWAVQFSAEKLAAMAQDALLLAKKLYDERDVQHGNLAAAISSLNEADKFLETVEPKPQYYAEILTLLTDCGEDLQQRYDDHEFRVKLATMRGDYEESLRMLRIMCEMVPDRRDARNQKARTQLLEIERRVQSLK